MLDMILLYFMKCNSDMSWQVKAGEKEGESKATGVKGLDTNTMSWQLAISDPHLMRLGDWLAEQHGEEGMAWLKEEGVSQWDLEGWQTKEACEQLNIVFIKDPQGQVWPFVMEQQTAQEDNIQVIAQTCNEINLYLMRSHDLAIFEPYLVRSAEIQ